MERVENVRLGLASFLHKSEYEIAIDKCPAKLAYLMLLRIDCHYVERATFYHSHMELVW